MSTKAVAASETAPIESKGWQWVAPDGEAIDTTSGNASSVTPSGFTNAGPVQSGIFQWRTQVFDLTKLQRGGTVLYVDGEGQAYRWNARPDAGPELTKLKAALANQQVMDGLLAAPR
ncbi:hypothetical protein AB0H77_33115 [Streptomyces sp. NPDC050844]|uniref:hypothetical protein n=1 Tax=Streptomyces sp. NPDC050844 TaxID=3155790 RepID=UPI0033CDD68C